MRAKRWVACFLCAMTAGSLHAQDSVGLQIAERGHAARANECVTFGVPVPASWSANNASAFRLTETDGTPIAAQFEILSRGAAPPQTTSAAGKWVLVSFMDSVASGATHNCVLDHSGPGPAPATPIREARPRMTSVFGSETYSDVRSTPGTRRISVPVSIDAWIQTMTPIVNITGTTARASRSLRAITVCRARCQPGGAGDCPL